MIKLDLYLDESGSFVSRPDREEANQLVGILVPRGTLDRAKGDDPAEEVFRQAYARAGLSFGGKVHGADMDSAQLAAVVHALVGILRDRRWTAIRLTNRTGVFFDDKTETYTRMVAELVTATLEKFTRSDQPRVQLRVFPERVALDDPQHIENPDSEEKYVPHYMDPREYEKKIREAFRLAPIRKGISERARKWELEEVQLRSKNSLAVQIPDLISNASFANYRKLKGHPEEAAALRAFLAEYDLRVSYLEAANRARELLDLDALGLALRELGEFSLLDDTTDKARAEADELFSQALERIGMLDGPARSGHLMELALWLQQLVDGKRDLEASRKAARWVRETVVGRLESFSPNESQTSAWLRVLAARWALTASNHLGDLAGGAEQRRHVDESIPAIATRWEYAPLVVDALLAKAVHLTDSFEHAAARSILETLDQSYGVLTEVLAGEIPGVFGDEIGSEARGKILGTLLQSEFYTALGCASEADHRNHVERARTLSDRALEQFSLPADIAQQRQYRSQLECIAGDLPAARGWLAKSIGATGEDHAALESRIMELEGPGQGFALLHWTRIARAATVSHDRSERENFSQIFDRSALRASVWVEGESGNYPAHGIRRNLAAAAGGHGTAEIESARSRLGQLRRLKALDTGGFVLALIEIAAMADVASNFLDHDPPAAHTLLDHDAPARPGLVQAVAMLRGRFADLGPAAAETLADFERAARALTTDPSDGAARKLMLSTARRVGY